VILMMMMKELQYVRFGTCSYVFPICCFGALFLLFVAACETSKKMLTWYAALRVMSAIESARL